MSSAATFSFACQCGARLQARPEMAGKKGKCKICGETFVIPQPPAPAAPVEKSEPASQGSTVSAEPAPAPPASSPVEKEHVCSICQTIVQSTEAAAKCNACGLPFHVECWEANLGCATYGCRNVNCLKTGPDVAIGHSAIAQAQLPAWQTQPSLMANQAKNDFPWEYVLLAGAAVAGLLSCVMCGLPSLAVGVAATIYMSQTPHPNQKVLAAVWAIVGITFLLGMMTSALIFMSR